jgi:hypothetical protein
VTRHRAVIFATMLSIVLLACWCHSGRAYVRLTHARFYTLASDPLRRPRCEVLMLASINGRLLLHRTTVKNPSATGLLHESLPAAGWTFDHVSSAPQFREQTMLQRLGFDGWSWGRTSAEGEVEGRGFCMPYWFLTAAAAAGPAWCVTTWMRRGIARVRRSSRGACLGCGYDLRASGIRCPECGLAVSPA